MTNFNGYLVEDIAYSILYRGASSILPGVTCLIGNKRYKIENLPYGSFRSEMTTVDTCIVFVHKIAESQSIALELLKNNYNLLIN